MKSIIITLSLLAAMTCQGQITLTPQTYRGSIFSSHPCGTWQAQPEEITEWHTVDTLGKKQSFPPERNWATDIWQPRISREWMDCVYRPCGSGMPYVLEQYRICSITGIRQMRERITPYKYIPAPVTEYERVRDSLALIEQPPIYRAANNSLDTGWSQLIHSFDSLMIWHNGVIAPHKFKKRKK